MEEKKLLFLPRGEIRTVKPFCDLFQIKPNDLKHIAEDMRQNGYDVAHPIILWRGAVVDGHTRLAAAEEAGIGDIPVVPRNFTDENEALEYAIKSQSNRRNLADSELLSCLAELDKRKAREENFKASREALGGGGKSAAATADLLGVSRAKVERLRTVQDHAPNSIKNAVASGEMSVNKAYNETMRQRRKENDTPGDVPSDKASRLAAISESIDGMLRKRFGREIEEFPMLRFSEEEIETLTQNIITAVRKYTGALPREEE